MKLAVLNGSPRGKDSNSCILAECFLGGFRATSGHTHTVHYLKLTERNAEHRAACGDADAVFLIFPLYTDAMPGVVKHFIDSLAVDNVLKGGKVFCMVQSGFPEAYHSTFVEKYLEKLMQRLGAVYAGAVIKGGVEGLRVMPERMTRKLRRAMTDLGRRFGKDGTLDADIVARLRTPLRMGPVRLAVARLMQWTGVVNSYWISQLKKHGAYERRFDQPYWSDSAVKGSTTGRLQPPARL